MIILSRKTFNSEIKTWLYQKLVNPGLCTDFSNAFDIELLFNEIYNCGIGNITYIRYISRNTFLLAQESSEIRRFYFRNYYFYLW